MKTIIIILLFMTTLAFGQTKIRHRHVRAIQFVNKDYQSRMYKKIIVFSTFVDAEQDIKIMASFASLGITVVSALDLLPPPKNYTEVEQSKIFDENGVDGIIRITQSKQSNDYVMGVQQTDIKMTLYDLKMKMDAVSFTGNSSGFIGGEAKPFTRFISKLADEFKPFVGR